jgi:hypothetical protein
VRQLKKENEMNGLFIGICLVGVIILWVMFLVWLTRYQRKHRIGYGYQIEDLKKIAEKQEQLLKEIKVELTSLREEKRAVKNDEIKN